MTAFHSILGAFFSNQSTSSTIFPQISHKFSQISPNLPEKELKKHDLQKKKRLHFDFGRHLCKLKAHKAILRNFSHILPKFTQILPGFQGIFLGFSSNQTFWQWASTPCTPTSYTTGLKLASKNFHATPVDARKSRFVPNTHDPFAWNVRIQRSPHPWRRLSLKFGILQ